MALEEFCLFCRQKGHEHLSGADGATCKLCGCPIAVQEIVDDYDHPEYFESYNWR